MKNENLLTNANKYIPLVMLNKDDEGNTALEVAHVTQRPKSFELMVHLLTTYKDFCFTKSMVSQLLKMIKLEIHTIQLFFNECTFTPFWIKEGVTINWEVARDDYVFASHTSYITEELLNNELNLKLKDE